MQITTIGLDIAKNVFQVHGIDAAEKVVVRKQLRRSKVIAFFEAVPPCLVGMEACASNARRKTSARSFSCKAASGSFAGSATVASIFSSNSASVRRRRADRALCRAI